MNKDEDFRPQSSILQVRDSTFIENLLTTIKIQRDEIERLEDEIRELKCL